MKKIILGIVTVAIAAVGYGIGSSAVASSTPTMVNPHDHDCHGMRCTVCKGTGFQPNTPFNCLHCQGTGRIGSY